MKPHLLTRVAEFLLADGHAVVGIDNLSDAHDVRLKRWRLAHFKSPTSPCHSSGQRSGDNHGDTIYSGEGLSLYDK